MPRRKLTRPRRKVTMNLDEELMQKLDLLVEDPLAKRSAYGKKSEVFNLLLSRMLEAMKTNSNTMTIHDLVRDLRGGK